MSAPTLGERALACGMRWALGVVGRTASGYSLVALSLANVDEGQSPATFLLDGDCFHDCDGTGDDAFDGAMPDCDHPSTQGCILAQASERWAAYWKGQRGDPALDVRRVTGGWQWRLSVATRHPSDGEEDVAFCSSSPTAPTYGEACVSALEGSPL